MVSLLRPMMTRAQSGTIQESESRFSGQASDACCGKQGWCPGESRPDWPALRQPFCPALISSNLESARSNLGLKSHIASRISRKVADVLALSACPKAKMLLFRRYPMIRGSEIL